MSDGGTDDAGVYRHLAFLMVPRRSHPHGSGWGGGYLEWPQREGYEIRSWVESATATAICEAAHAERRMAERIEDPLRTEESQ